MPLYASDVLGEMYPQLKRPKWKPDNYFWIMFIISILLILFMFIGKVNAEEVNLNIIATIESNNNPLAYNKVSKARGLYQITPICLKDYNTWHPTTKLPLNALFSPFEAFKVAKWYVSIRIPQMLAHFKILDTIENRLICYNWGIKDCIDYNKGKGELPKETQQYILRYKKLSSQK